MRIAKIKGCSYKGQGAEEMALHGAGCRRQRKTFENKLNDSCNADEQTIWAELGARGAAEGRLELRSRWRPYVYSPGAQVQGGRLPGEKKRLSEESS